MYEFLSGKIVRKDPTRLVLDVRGVGYELTIPLSTFHTLGTAGEETRVLTHFVVREDAHQLCGFATDEERDLFRLLISVSGIGPKMALTVLSGIGMAEFRKAVIEGALHVLTSIPGIGRKTAERLVVELREKVMLLEPKGPRAMGRPGEQNRLVEDSLQALVSLGYRRGDAKRAVQKVLAEEMSGSYSIEELIRASLKHI